jgi:hypothetical protein
MENLTPKPCFSCATSSRQTLKAVYSNLSDGAHGHLTLVLTAAQYSLITNSPFIHPAHPGTLISPSGTTGPMITATKEAHFEQLRLFREVQGVEKALIQQVVKAINPSYLATATLSVELSARSWNTFKQCTAGSLPKC